MDLPHPGHLARVLAVLGGLALGLGGMALRGLFPECGRKVSVIGALVLLLAGVLAIAAARL